jgi:hypothetical protein
MTEAGVNLDPNSLDRLAHLESAVWAGIADRRRKAQRMTAAFGVATFIAISAGSYSIGSMQAARDVLHASMTAELSQGGFTTGLAG